MKRRKVIAEMNLRMKRRIISPNPPSVQIEGRRKLLSLLRAALLETTQVQLTRLPIHLPKLPPAFHGFKIIQLSDVHHSSFVSESDIVTAAERVNQLQPDLVVLTGDYVSHSVDFIPGCARALGKLKAKHGVFAVLGNHDHWTDGQLMKTALESHGIRVLCKACATTQLAHALAHAPIRQPVERQLSLLRQGLPPAMLWRSRVGGSAKASTGAPVGQLGAGGSLSNLGGGGMEPRQKKVRETSVILVAIFAVVFLGERPGPREWAGILLVGAGVVLLALKR